MQLGDRVRDEVTGFEGVVLGRAEFLYEATQCRVHTRTLSDTNQMPRDGIWFEEDRLALIEEHALVGFKIIAGNPLKKVAYNE